MNGLSHHFYNFIFDFRIVQDRIMAVGDNSSAPEVYCVMLAFGIQPVTVNPLAVESPSEAFIALASAAQSYLRRLDDGVSAESLPSRVALLTRVRGTGPGVHFGQLVEALEPAAFRWVCPFEGCSSIRGAVVRGADVVGDRRDDAFLFLEFAPYTTGLPLHIHEDSDRFIYGIGGRGFFHVSHDPLERGRGRSLRHVPVRDRDALMFRRGTVHTFSTGEHPLTLLSYHRPYVPLEDEKQFRVSERPEKPSEFLRGLQSSISFDSAWSVL
jgi:mannose-6-phosphate isomerase-like protein (cupin superfamily)